MGMMYHSTMYTFQIQMDIFLLQTAGTNKPDALLIMNWICNNWITEYTSSTNKIIWSNLLIGIIYLSTSIFTTDYLSFDIFLPKSLH